MGNGIDDDDSFGDVSGIETWSGLIQNQGEKVGLSVGPCRCDLLQEPEQDRTPVLPVPRCPTHDEEEDELAVVGEVGVSAAG